MANVRALVIAVGGSLSVALVANGQPIFFDDHMLFTQHAEGQDKTMKFLEDFEESTVGQGQKIPFPNSLQHGVPRPTFDNGINATNLVIQTNVTPGPTPLTPNPSASQTALWVNGPGFLGSNSVKVGTDEFLTNDFSSIDLIFTTDDKTAIALDVSTYPGFNQGHGGFIFSVYDLNDVVLGTYLMPGPTPTEPAKNFFGVWSATPIGRVNVWGIFAAPQPFAVDNIEMWSNIPAPGSAVVLGLSALAWARRRR